MKRMGRYCKAYPIEQFRRFAGWMEKAENARREDQTEEDGIAQPRPLTEDTFLYLQENFVVTDGVFLDENIIYDAVTPEWIRFCREELGFEPPHAADSDTGQA